MRRVPGREMLARKHRQLTPSALAAGVGGRARGARSIVARTCALVSITRVTVVVVPAGTRFLRSVNAIAPAPVGAVHATAAFSLGTSRVDSAHASRLAQRVED